KKNEDQTEMIVRFDADGVIDFANEAFLRANEIPPEQVRGMNLLSIIPPEQHDRFLNKLSQLSPASPTRSEIVRVIRDGGRVEWEEWHDRAIYDADRQFVTYQAVGRNVTELKITEQKLRESE
ncbi:MAG: PAS domain S-box protein, partial [Planctomycetaceae bacterium]|nr:PAS domain S-box protein [Planctomycetaceae bacterium]